MNIVVCVKQTFDTEAKIVFDSQGRIDPNGVNLIVNPYDEFALEEGIRLKEKFGGTVTAVSMGGARAQEALRTALAMGADKALLVSDPALNDADEWVSTQALAQAISKIPHDIILAGRVAIDDGSSQVCVRLAEELHLPSVSTVLKFSVEGNKVTAVREIDGGTETLEVELPVVLTAQKGINGNEPRYPSVAGIMKAKKKELKTMTLADLGLSALEPKMKISKYDLPAPRQAGKKIPGEPAAAAQELVRLLHEEAKVL
ncbi:Electron transfer flavoprotein, alpha/beta-subunit, N-terminal [Acididesulfobacillus acetoxydans]|uniref:Electron transfer flavoprotein subunit beta n=1 Tax=Acididesulfobacillus acetoxydans TaxID=1561005 RepID=A0A8S0X370_9FIRM|nr:electron transfer flavoprotein subunit beta/FixA family protein [Acididesulfobacillus acetoxydans]CAA7599830.1 Electron transfer flavoprotein, alpha/beta-subunit, N-terminal [Acididesulfobacillus acetoxydans]CEJ07396.1 Electron transfer flavoprotein subunit beta [Acididesulfobacillus acetoxydans]